MLEVVLIILWCGTVVMVNGLVNDDTILISGW
jgi:hypothetical protein